MMYAAAFAAMGFMLPRVNDPYQAPHLFAMALVALAMMLRPSRNGSSLETPMLLAFTLWGLSAVASSDVNVSLIGSNLAPFDGCTAVITYFCLALGAARLGRPHEDAMEAIAWISIPVAALAIAQRFGYTDPVMPGALPTGMRAISTIGSPVYLGAVLAVCATAAAGIWERPVARVALPLILLALWATGTRGAQLAALAGLAVRLPRRARWLLAMVIPVVLLSGRMTSGGSDVARLEIWKGALKVFLAHPLLGTGPGTFSLASREFISDIYIAVNGPQVISQHAHNMVLHVAATIGLAGLAALAVMGWRLARLAREQAALAAVLVAYIAAGMFNPMSHAATALLALIFGAASSRPSLTPQPRLGYAAGMLAAVYLTGSIVIGDHYYYRGLHAKGLEAAMEYQEAAGWNRWDMKLAALKIDSALTAMNQIDPADRPALAAAVVDYTRTEVGKHPADPLAHEMLSKALTVAARLSGGVLAAAMAEIQHARRLAPTFSPLIYRQMVLARLMGDDGTARVARAELVRIEGLRN